MDETLPEERLEAIKKGEDQKSGSMRELFVNYWWPVLKVALMTAGGTVSRLLIIAILA